jgi:hypothetical protein
VCPRQSLEPPQISYKQNTWPIAPSITTPCPGPTACTAATDTTGGDTDRTQYASTAVYGNIPPADQAVAAADSACSGHICPLRATDELTNLRPATPPIRVTQPDGTTLTSTHVAELPGLSHLPPSAAHVDVFPDKALPHSLLISMANFCDVDCKAVFHKHGAEIFNPDGTLLFGIRNQRTRL